MDLYQRSQEYTLARNKRSSVVLVWRQENRKRKQEDDTGETHAIIKGTSHFNLETKKKKNNLWIRTPYEETELVELRKYSNLNLEYLNPFLLNPFKSALVMIQNELISSIIYVKIVSTCNQKG